MRCPYCRNAETKVVDKRNTPDDSGFRRRRECMKCERRFTTYERIEELNIIVTKKNGQRRPFDKRKIMWGVQRACEKRPVTEEQMQRIVENVERRVLRLHASSIPSKRIGEYVLKEIKKVDEVAFIRFASVYRSFKDVDEFHKEIGKLTEKKE